MMAYFFRLHRSLRGVAWGWVLAGVLLPGLMATAADGDFVWARAMGGAGFDAGRGIAVDTAGNAYTTGFFGGTVDFDPGPGTFNLTSAGSNSIFVVKLDSGGDLVWARAMGGAGRDAGLGITVDSAGNVYIVGQFTGTADFDPGPGTFNLTSAGSTDIFVQKLDSEGNLVWARAMGGTEFDEGRGIAVDGAGNVHITGTFRGTADFDPGPGTFNLTAGRGDHVFVQKLDSEGNLAWARSMGGVSVSAGFGIAVDGAGNVHTTGQFVGRADFDPGPGTLYLVSAGGFDIFVQKLDSAGNLVWARAMGGAEVVRGRDIAVDSAGNVYTTGDFAGTADFDPGPGTFNLVSAGSFDIFVQKLDSEGNLMWARGMGGTEGDSGRGIAVDDAGNVHTTGFFEGTADFDPGAGSFHLTSAGDEDIFAQKLDGDGNLVWARAMGGAGSDAGLGIAVDGAGNVHTTGQFADSADFNRGFGTFNLISAGHSDIFVQKLSGPDPNEGLFGACSASSVGMGGGGRLGDWVVLGVALLVLVGWRGRGGVPGRG